MALTKVSGGILDPGISVAGIVTATGFDGPFIGGSDGINAGIVTATGLDVNGNGDINGNLIVGGNLTANGDFTTLNTTLREVELLRVDANSSAAAGIITQTGAGDLLRLYDGASQVVTVDDEGNVGLGSAIPAAPLDVSGRAQIGGTNDIVGSPYNYFYGRGSGGDGISVYAAEPTLELVGTNGGSHAASLLFRTAANDGIGFNYNPGGNTLELKSFDATGNNFQIHASGSNVSNLKNMLKAVSGGAVELYHNNNRKIFTTSTGVQISCDPDGDGLKFEGTTRRIDLVANSNRSGAQNTILELDAHWNDTSVAFIALATGDDTTNKDDGRIRFFTKPSGGTIAERVRIETDGKVGIGTDNVQTLLHLKGEGGSSSGIRFDNSHDTVFQYFTNDANDSDFLITYNGTGGAELTIHADGNLGLNEANGDDVTIGTSSVIDNSKLTIVKAAAGLTTAIALGNGNASGDGSKIISTKSLVLSADYDANNADTKSYLGFETDGTEKLRIDSGGRLQIGASNNTGSNTKFVVGFGNNINTTALINTGDVDTNALTLSNWDGSTTTNKVMIAFDNSGNGGFDIGMPAGSADFAFQASGGERLRIKSDGHLLPGAAGTQNLGSTTAEWGNVYIADSKNIYFGSDQDAEIYHNGSGFYLNNSTGNTYIRSGGGQIIMRSSNNYDAIVAKTNEVELFYNSQNHSTPKLTTSATGITVDGEVAASQDYPDFEPVLNFNFAGSSTQLDPRLLYRRSGVASFTNANGLVKLVGENTPRFDHDPISRKNKGILIEHSRTNNNKSSVYQNNFTGWTLNQFVSQEYSSETAPDGSSNVTLVSANTANNYHYAYISHSGSTFTGARTVSAWFKKLGTTTYNPQLRIFGVGNGISYANFVLTGDGTVNSGGSDTTAATITPYPNGWYRCTLSWNDSTSHYGGGIVISNNTGAELPTFTGDADITKGFLVYGFQDEAGAYPSSYIPTYGRTQTRGADLLVIDGDDSTALSDAYNDQEGTLVVEYHNVTTDGSYVATIDDGSGDNRFGISNSNSSQGISVSGGSSQGQLDNGTPIVGATNKMAHAYKLNDRGLSLNGNDATQDNGFALPTGIRFIWIGCRQGSYDFLGSTISRFMYYTKRLPNSQLKLLTSQ